MGGVGWRGLSKSHSPDDTHTHFLSVVKYCILAEGGEKVATSHGGVI